MDIKFGDKGRQIESLRDLDGCYRLYQSCFPDPDERESLAKLKLLFLRVSGWSFATLQDGGSLTAACHFCRVSEAAAFIEHLYVEPSRRLQGIGSSLLNGVSTMLFDSGVEELYAEMNDAELMSEDEIARDDPDPRVRLIFWKRQGWQTVNGPYRQPALVNLVPTAAEAALIGTEGEEDTDEPAGTVDYLQIICRLRSPSTVLSAGRFKDAVGGYFKTFLPDTCAVADEPCYKEIGERLRNVSQLELLPIGSPRSLAQPRNANV